MALESSCSAEKLAKLAAGAPPAGARTYHRALGPEGCEFTLHDTHLRVKGLGGRVKVFGPVVVELVHLNSPELDSRGDLAFEESVVGVGLGRKLNEVARGRLQVVRKQIDLADNRGELPAHDDVEGAARVDARGVVDERAIDRGSPFLDRGEFCAVAHRSLAT